MKSSCKKMPPRHEVAGGIVKGRGPNGRRLCRICEVEIPKGRLYYCSSSCAQEQMIRSSASAARGAVRRRDKGICAKCGLDCEAIDKRADRLRDRANWWAPGMSDHRDSTARKARARRAIEAFAARYPDPIAKAIRRGLAIWEADHIVPVVKGGGACGLSNLRTLCRNCHVEETRDLARERAKEKRFAKTGQPGIFEAMP